MSNIGKYMWGESKDNYCSSLFDTIEECKENIKTNVFSLLCEDFDYVFIGQITREFDYTALARDMSEMAENVATEFDADASYDVDLWKDIESLVKSSIDMRPFKVRMIEKVNLEDLR